jgi:hypothetical protein
VTTTPRWPLVRFGFLVRLSIGQALANGALDHAAALARNANSAGGRQREMFRTSPAGIGLRPVYQDAAAILGTSFAAAYHDCGIVWTPSKIQASTTERLHLRP